MGQEIVENAGVQNTFICDLVYYFWDRNVLTGTLTFGNVQLHFHPVSKDGVTTPFDCDYATILLPFDFQAIGHQRISTAVDCAFQHLAFFHFLLLFCDDPRGYHHAAV
jgi:hypothetical protein